MTVTLGPRQEAPRGQATRKEVSSDRLPLLATLLLLPALLGLAAVWAFEHNFSASPLSDLANLVGPTTQSLLHGDGLTVTTEAMGTPGNPISFHAGRMPLPSMVVGLGIRLFGNHYLPVAFFKALLLLLPLQIAIYLVWRQMPQSPRRRLMISALLLVPFAMTALLADIVNMQVEEGYSYSLLALAIAILFFRNWRPAAEQRTGGFGIALLFAFAMDGVYLAKSSMVPAVAVLLLAFLWLERRTPQRLLVLLLVLAAPIGWALHQHHASGRYGIGTSIDGINLHKGNSPGFLDHYPPPPGDSLDRYDSDLNRGMHFSDEWSFNDYHQKAALAYLRAHPKETLTGDLRKFNILCLSVRKYGSTESHGVMLLAETLGLALFRLIFWAAIICAVYVLNRAQSAPHRVAAMTFLALVAACALPYLVGFAYTRHASVLIYPAVLMCSRMLMD